MKSLIMKIGDNLKKISALPVAVKASVAYMVVNFLQKGISFLTAPIFTRLLTTSEFGQISIYSSWVEIMAIFAMFNLYSSVYNNGILEYKDDQKCFTFSVLTSANVLTAAVFFIVWFINHFVFRFLQISDLLIIFMFFCFIWEPAFEFWKTQQRFAYRYKAICVYTILIMIGSPILAVIGIYIFPAYKVEARIIGAQIINILLGIGCYVLETYRGRLKIKFQYWKYGFLYNLPMLPYAISTYILNCSDRIMLSYLINDAAAGLYSIAYTVASVVSVLWTSINATLTPTIYKRCHNNQIQTLSSLVIPIVTCFGIVCVVIMGLAPEIIRFLAPASYLEGINAVPAIVGGAFFNSVFTMYSNIFWVKKKQNYIMFAGIFAAVLNFVLNLLLIPHFGYMAAGYTTLASYFLQDAGIYFLSKKVIGDRVYKREAVFALAAVVLISASVFPIIYQYVLLRYLILIILMIVLWKKRNVFLAIRKPDML